MRPLQGALSGQLAGLRVLVLAPSRRAITETFVRANLERLPFATIAYFGDERPLDHPLRLSYGLAILLSKALTRLRLLRLASVPGSLVAWMLLCHHKPDVLMVEFGFHAVRVMEVAAWTPVPMVVHFRGSDASAEGRIGLLHQRYQRLMRVVSGVIVKSQPMRRVLLGLGAPAQRLLVSPSGADAAQFQGSDPATAPPLFLTVGRFVAKKGPLETIRAFAAMRQRLEEPLASRTTLVMVGEGPLLSQARQLICSLALEQAVSLVGAARQADVAAWLQQARAFVLHSRVAPDGDSEGSPVAVMEAQLSGLPVVATRHGGIPEVVREGETGFLVEEGDTNAMADAMALLAADPTLAARMGRAGRERMLAGFTVEHHVAQVAALLRSVVSSPPSPRVSPPEVAQ
jgi:glycosyltransferase involved in cell wall biosynthesis